MSPFEHLLKSVVLPPLFSVRQRFPDDALADVALSATRSLDESGLAERLTGGDIAIGVGSRGIANLGIIVRAVVDWFRQHGSTPFVFPAMGSHGGATAEGQRDVLAHLGITEVSVGCSIKSTMDTVCVGTLDNGLPVHLDRFAARADGIFMINRIKPHTGFSGQHESGLVKMAVIGMGKQHGAEHVHQDGFSDLGRLLPMIARVIFDKVNILGAVAVA